MRAERPRPRRAHAKETPEWYTSEPYVFTGYRVDYTIRHCLASPFCLHNETCNIWSHLACLFLWLATASILVHSPAFHAAPAASKVVCFATIGLGSLMYVFPFSSARRCRCPPSA